MSRFLRDFSPWIAFYIFTGFKILDVERAAIACLLLALSVSFKNLKKLFILEWGTLGFFLVLSFGTVIPFYASIRDHPSLSSNFAISFIVWISLVFRTPFTLQYAMEKSPKALTKTPHFLRLHYILTFFWAGIFTLLTLLSFFSDFIAKNNMVINDIMPIVFIILSFHFTKWFPNFYKKKKQLAPTVPIVNISQQRKYILRMNEELILRPGEKKEAKIIAYYMQMAGGGIVEFLLGDLIKNVTSLDILENLVTEEKGEFSYHNTTVCEIQKKIIGIIHCVPLSSLSIPNEEGGLIPQDRILHLKPLFSSTLKNSLYLHALAIDPAYRGRRISRHLLDLVVQRAQQHQFTSVSLHAWADNTIAVRFYKSLGFETVEVLPIPSHPRLPHEGGMLLMKLHV